MKNLKEYVEQKNRFRKFFSKAVPLVIGENNELIASLIQTELSPENLSCDGERRGAALMRRKKFLVAAAKELMKSDKGIRIPF